MPKNDNNIPVFDYRDGRKGNPVNDSEIHGVKKIPVGGNKEMETPYKNDGQGFHGGVLQNDRNGNKRIVYH